MTSFLDEEKPPRWFVFLMAVIITVAVMLALSSCSSSQIANRKLRRADKLIKQAEALGVKIKQDTVFVEKVIPGPETTVNVPVDRLIHSTDTFTVYQDKIKLHYVTYRDTLRVRVECPDSVIKAPIIVNRTIHCPDCPKDKFWKGLGYGAGGVLLLLIILGLLRLVKG